MHSGMAYETIGPIDLCEHRSLIRMQNALDKYLEYAATVLRFFRNHNLSITASAVGFDQSSRKKMENFKDC